MHKSKTYVLLLLLLVLPYACNEPIDLMVDQTGGQLIIFGRITNGTFGNYVEIARTGAGGEAQQPEENALVQIKSNRGELIALEETTPGRYDFLDSDLTGEVGVSYELEVVVDCKTYTTNPQPLPENVGRETMSWELRDIETITTAGVAVTDWFASISSRTDFDELPDEFYLRWDIEEAYTYLGTFLPPSNFPRTGGRQVQCFVENDLNEQCIFLHNGTLNRADYIPDRVYVDRIVDRSFQALHYFNLIRSTINKETYDYWFKMDGIVNRQGSIFDVPPAPLPGNIQAEDGEEVLGFFEVIYADTTRLPITRSDVPVWFYDPCIKRGADFIAMLLVPRDCIQCLIDEGIVDEECLFCGVLPNSSSRRPSYF